MVLISEAGLWLGEDLSTPHIPNAAGVAHSVNVGWDADGYYVVRQTFLLWSDPLASRNLLSFFGLKTSTAFTVFCFLGMR